MDYKVHQGLQSQSVDYKLFEKIYKDLEKLHPDFSEERKEERQPGM